MEMFQRHIIPSTATVRDAIEGLDRLSGDTRTLIVTDGEDRPAGTVTDGDIRRALIRGVALDDNIGEAMNRPFRSVTRGNVDIAFIRDVRNAGIRLLPVIDEAGKLVRIVDLRKVDSLLPLSALIMAGGKGERLRPMTLTTPKPLLTIEGKAIIDYNIEALARVGVDEVAVSTAYLAEQLDEHFSKPVAGISVRTIREEQPRGTIGALADVLPMLTNDTVLVMNSDLLTDIALDEMYIRHRQEEADITVAAIPYTVSVPYAILSTEGSRITSLREKPTYSLYANGGIYMISRKAAALVPSDRRYDATDLIDEALARGLKVVYFPINGTWIDVGTPADFRHAADIMKYHGGKHRPTADC